MYSLKVEVPGNAKVEIEGKRVKFSGEKGQVERNFAERDLKIEMVEGKIVVSSESERREARALIGTIAAHVKNMITGVTKGFIYRLRVVYSHFPVTVKVEGDKVLIQNFLGERMPRISKIVGKTQVKVEGSDLIVSGASLEDVGQTAANMEQTTRIVGYDRRKFLDGIYIVGRE